MLCSKCHSENLENAKFCGKCGNPLNQTSQESLENIALTSLQNNALVQKPTVNYAQNAPIENQSKPKGSMNYVKYILDFLIKPFKTIEEKESNLNDTKNSILLCLIVTVFMVVMSLISTILSTIRVPSYDLKAGLTYKWDFSLIKNVKFLEVIGKNFVIYAGILLLIALVYYFAGLVKKKNVSFQKLLSITSSSMIPLAISLMVLAPLLKMIWAPLYMICILVGSIYSLILFYECMNQEFMLEKEEKLYFNFICFLILGVAIYFIYTNFLIPKTVSGGLDQVLDLFK